MKEKTPKELARSLTKTEKEVLRLVCQHKSYKEIAKAFFLQEVTIRTHISNIYQKLELKDLDRDQRILMIHNIYCPLLQKQPDQQQAQPEIEIIEETPDPEPVFLEDERVAKETPEPAPNSPEDERVAEETPDPEPVFPEAEQIIEETPELDPISPEDEKMIDEDEMALVAYKQEPNTRGKKKMVEKKKRGCGRFIFTLILGALMVIGAWYTWQNFLKDMPIVQSIVPKTVLHAGAYEVGEWAMQDDVWVRVSEYKVTSHWVSVYFEVWNKKGHDYFFSWSPRDNFTMVDNQNNKYDVGQIISTKNENLDTNEKTIISGFSRSTVDFDNDSIYKPGVTDLYITVEYFATIEEAVFHIDLTK